MTRGDLSEPHEAPSPSAAGLAALVDLGTPTAIGSLPLTDPDEAVALVLAALPELPALPTLPRRDPRESMIAQAAWAVRGVEVAPDGTVEVAPDLLDADAPLGDPGLDGAPFVTWRRFLAAVAGRTAPVKVQMTGPVTLARALHDAGAPPATAIAVAAAAVRERSRALQALLARHVPEAPIVAVLDEPGLVGGPPSALADPDTVVDTLSGALATWEAHAVTGVHCCGPTDWKLLLQAGPALLSAPVGADLAPGAAALAGFLDRGGWIAWGAVPTDRPLGDSASHWWRELSGQWCELVRLGCDPVRIRRQALVTPACGLAAHDAAQVGWVLDLSRNLGGRIRDQLAGVKLSVGA